MSLYQINTNVHALKAFSSLQQTNEDLAVHQLRLATGSRLNRAEDDAAGYSIAMKLESKVRGQAQALANITDAKSMLTVAEGGMTSIMDILQTMKEKAVQAANDTLGDDEIEVINDHLDELSKEIDDIATNAEFNDVELLDGSAGSLSFQVGAGSTDTFEVTIDAVASSDLSIGTSTLDVGSSTVAATMGAIEDAIDTLSDAIASLGDAQTRLSFKHDNLQTSNTNYKAAKSGIMDADFAKEQLQITKLQILQQTGLASLAQANAGPQNILSLIGGR